MHFRTSTAWAVMLCVATVGWAGIDPQNFDHSVKPQDDFDQFANGGWKKANPVPAAYSTWGAFHELEERNQQAVRAILERVAQHPDAQGIERQVGDFYASAMDEAGIEAAGITPLKPELARLAAIESKAEVQAAVARLHRWRIWAGFQFTSEQDPKNTAMMIAYGWQAGLGLPDRDYYLRDDEKSQTLRTQYVAHVARMLELAGAEPAAAQADAVAVMQLETALAKGSKTNVELRDPVANFHKLSPVQLQELTPHFDWARYWPALGIAEPEVVDVGQPEFMQAFDAQLASTPASTWRTYLRWHLLNATAPYLSAAFVNEQFDFYGRKLKGTPELLERWKRAYEAVDESIGEALGQLYVAEYFPPESKQRMLVLVENLRTALGERLRALSWMDESTKAQALAKLAAFGVKIGYPDKWIDYGKLQVDRGPYVLNVLRAREFNAARELAKIGRPVDRTEWGMTPPTVNAYYNPTMNEIVFPAGILQPPFFDAQADDAVNYGAIGAVIGHEMTHGFDDQGRQYAADGSLTDWWTPESAQRFNERAAVIVKQYAAYVALDDLHLNGELTQGENIADLGGLTIAYAALQKALDGRPGDPIDGFTPEQRFFLSWATAWHQNIRPEALRLRVHTDVHSPAHFRVNGPLANLEEFATAFAIPEGTPMRRPASERVIIW
ncbi:M13 family metallopeptidase [Opitutus terrae]|uniref:Endothelin-converting enzyme 1 n=1 Tax=Opitutus terrae (strain DSM 11246 / JCM 15787 / PB90-1) TaxID=452637 RepID=B2A0D1_OPITP|nr:M13 family metallopeptidase [Opitutus terrae]ACB77885.1 Endothelin-converting enzyme 1 [Opitutus terrae PB90-1]